MSFLDAMRIQSDIPVESCKREIRSLNFGHRTRRGLDVGQRRSGDAAVVVEASMTYMVAQERRWNSKFAVEQRPHRAYAQL